MRRLVPALVLLVGALLSLGLRAQSAAPLEVTGIVFLDRNANGVRDRGEAGIPNVVVSDQVLVVRTGAGGGFRLPASSGWGMIFVSVPDGYRAVGPFWRETRFAPGNLPLEFALAPAPAPADFLFIHASDTHISEQSVVRTQLLRAVVDSVQPAFVLITGDLVRDALRVPEEEALAYFKLFQQEAAQFKVPLWTSPGNHDTFGIERHRSLVSPKHPLYGRGMYRHLLGPDYYSFTFGGIHFVCLNTVDIDDLWYYGHVDSTQVEWLRRDLAQQPPETPVVTFNHIPFFTAVETVNGYMDGPPAATSITVGGKTQFRHSVSNAGAILELIAAGHPYPLALGGHMHTRESLSYAGVPTRFHQSAAVIAPSEAAGMTLPSGVTVYRVRAGKVDDGTFVRF
jgi:hypothetical protein